MPLNDESFRRLRGELILATIVGTFQERELVFQDQRRPELKVYMYKEPNHKRPHVHIYFGNEEATSICLATREILAGTMSAKLLKPLISWISEHEADLLRVWDEIQQGNKPELLWARSA
jgi:Domain of unknown function (DUF4160)